MNATPYALPHALAHAMPATSVHAKRSEVKSPYLTSPDLIPSRVQQASIVTPVTREPRTGLTLVGDLNG